MSQPGWRAVEKQVKKVDILKVSKALIRVMGEDEVKDMDTITFACCLMYVLGTVLRGAGFGLELHERNILRTGTLAPIIHGYEHEGVSNMANKMFGEPPDVARK